MDKISRWKYPYTLPFMGGVYEKPEDEIREDLKEIEDLFNSGTVFVTHSPARGVLDGGHGSSALALFLQENSVRAHINGHGHRSFGRKDKHFNVAAANRAQAMILDLNTMKSQIVRA